MERDYADYFVEHVHQGPNRQSPARRELDALRYTSHGLKERECAAAMEVSEDTVKQHLASARRKLAAKNTAHAVAIALRLGLID